MTSVECYTTQYTVYSKHIRIHPCLSEGGWVEKMAAPLRKDASASDAMANIRKIPPLKIGAKIRLITCLGTELQGTVDAFEEKTKMLILSILMDIVSKFDVCCCLVISIGAIIDG